MQRPRSSSIPRPALFIHRSAVMGPVTRGVLSTNDPHVGMTAPFSEIGQSIHSYPHPYTQASSTFGDNLGTLCMDEHHVTFVVEVRDGLGAAPSRLPAG